MEKGEMEELARLVAEAVKPLVEAVDDLKTNQSVMVDAINSLRGIVLKTERAVAEVKANVGRHDNRFTAVDGRLVVLDDNGRAIFERLHAIEEALEIEAAEAGGTLGERLERLEKQVAIINVKLKAG